MKNSQSRAFIAALVIASTLPLAAVSQSAAPIFGAPVDPTTPIEITANRLDVFQERRQAVFQGAVEAIQGKLTLKTQKLIVFYDNSGNGPAPATGTNGKISQLQAQGGVQVFNADERAKGDSAVYEVKDRLIKLSGNVVLTKGTNTLQGHSLVINLNTGTSKLEGGVAATTGQNGRVKALFEPSEKK